MYAGVGMGGRGAGTPAGRVGAAIGARSCDALGGASGGGIGGAWGAAAGFPVATDGGAWGRETRVTGIPLAGVGRYGAGN